MITSERLAVTSESCSVWNITTFMETAHSSILQENVLLTLS